MERYICIHGHFYQPPRENPWLEAIELQDAAYPYHDWNARITAECYATNAKSRILDEGGRIIQMANNYAKISFNFGPTLLAWLEEKSPDVYQAILEADRESQETFSGHGSALAQAYNHMILPLANGRDKHIKSSGGSGTSSTDLAEVPRGCGSRRPRWTWEPSTSLRSRGSSLPSSLRTRPTGFVALERRGGRKGAVGKSTPPWPIPCIYHRVGPLRSSFTMAPSPVPWPLRDF